MIDRKGDGYKITNHKEKNIQGFLTVEAALVLPIFIYSILAFIYLLQIIGIQEDLQNAITETGFYAAKYAYVYDYLSEEDGENVNADEKGTSQKTAKEEVTKTQPMDSTETEEKNLGLSASQTEEKNSELSSSKIGNSVENLIAHSIDSSFFKLKIRDYLDIEKINRSAIKGGYDGIQTYLSSFMQEDSMIDIILVYKIKLPLVFIEINDIQVVQRVRMHGWNGHKVSLKTQETEKAKESEKIVYITQTGTVYHLSKNCTHLALSIRMIDSSQIDNVRNSSGGKYKQCNVCNSRNLSEVNQVYITDTGDRYHISLDCSGLKRTIISVPLSEVSDRSLCTRCGSQSE